VFGKPTLTTAAFLHPLEFVKVVASLMPKEMQAAITHRRLERVSDDELIRVIRQGALILQRRMRTHRSSSRSAGLYSVEPAAFDVAFGCKADMAYCSANVCF
jgi:hypothetical protein